jgi:adenosine deaminase
VVCPRPNCTCIWKAGLEFAARNRVKLRRHTADELCAAYNFNNLQSFLDLCFEGCRVLVLDQDFYDLTSAYLRRAHDDGGRVTDRDTVTWVVRPA